MAITYSAGREALVHTLFAEVQTGECLVGVLDAARNFDIPNRLKSSNTENYCLYEGERAEKLWYVAPYVVRCEQKADFVQWLLNEGWGNSWGIFLVAKGLEEIRDHLRKFLLVKVDGEDDKDFYFRFYDPRVLRTYLPTCTEQERKDFFGKTRCFLVEGPGGESLLKYSINDPSVRQEKLV